MSAWISNFELNALAEAHSVCVRVWEAESGRCCETFGRRFALKNHVHNLIRVNRNHYQPLVFVTAEDINIRLKKNLLMEMRKKRRWD